jgi:hypothetical protein
MANNVKAVEDEGTRNPFAKFSVASFAALCAVFFPQIVLYLKHADSKTLEFPDSKYIAVGIGLALMVGVIALIFEHGTRRTLAQTFMTALGVPAIFSGTVGTVGLAENGLVAQQAATAAFHQAAKSEGIAIGPAIEAPTSGVFDKGAWLEIVGSAYAAGGPALAQAPQAQVGYSAQFVIPRYLVVLDRTPNAAAANARVQQLRQRVPDATVLQSGNEFLVVAGTSPLAEGDALNRATSIKREGIANPTLAPVRAR